MTSFLIPCLYEVRSIRDHVLVKEDEIGYTTTEGVAGRSNTPTELDSRCVGLVDIESEEYGG